MEGSKNLFCSSNFSWIRERIPSKFINNPDISPKNVHQLWATVITHSRFCRVIVDHTPML